MLTCASLVGEVGSEEFTESWAGSVASSLYEAFSSADTEWIFTEVVTKERSHGVRLPVNFVSFSRSKIKF
jgi:hypothetical protein